MVYLKRLETLCRKKELKMHGITASNGIKKVKPVFVLQCFILASCKPQLFIDVFLGVFFMFLEERMCQN